MVVTAVARTVSGGVFSRGDRRKDCGRDGGSPVAAPGIDGCMGDADASSNPSKRLAGGVNGTRRATVRQTLPAGRVWDHAVHDPERYARS